MESKIKALEGTAQELEIKLTEEEVAPFIDSELKKIQPQIVLPGFRAGKVPLNLIKQRYGESIKQDACQEAIIDAFSRIAQEKNLRVIGRPHIHDIKFEDDLVVGVIHFDVPADFEPIGYKELTLDEPVHAVGEEEVEAEIDHIRLQFATQEDAEFAETDLSVLDVEFSELDAESGAVIIGGKKEAAQVFLGDKNVIPELKDKLLGAKAGDTFTFTPEADKGMFLCSVKKVSRLIPAEITPEFVKQITGDRLETEEDLRADIGFKLQERWDEESRKLMEQQAIEKIVQQNMDFPVPQDIILQHARTLSEEFFKQYKDLKPNEEQIRNLVRAYVPIAEKQVRWEFVKDKIVEIEGIEVEEFDIDPIIEQEAERTGSDKEALKKRLMENEGFMANMLNKKVLDFMFDFATTEEMSFEDYRAKYMTNSHEDHDHDHDHEGHDHDHEGHDHDHDHAHEHDEEK